MNQTQHDELAQLFASAMQVTPQQAAQQQSQQQEQQRQRPPSQQVFPSIPTLLEPVPPNRTQSEKESQPIHYISAHYYPSAAHTRPSPTPPPSRSPPPPYHEALMPEIMAATLRANSIDPSALLPNQIHLFQHAEHEQRERLLELWRIAPPSYPLEEHLNTGTWVGTTVEREEVLAKVRWEEMQRQQSEQSQQQHQLQQESVQPQNNHNFIWNPPQEEHMLDTFIPPSSTSTATRASFEEPISPIREPGEVAWPPAARMRAAHIASGGHSRSQSLLASAEPYITDGYAGREQSGFSPSVDPVYAAARGGWEAPNYAAAVQQEEDVRRKMEEQYGGYQQVRNFAEWQEVNHGVRAGGEDLDMEL